MNNLCELFHSGRGWNGCGNPQHENACDVCDYKTICKHRGYMPTCPICDTALTPVRTHSEICSLPPDNGGGLGIDKILGFECQHGTIWLSPENGIDPRCPLCGKKLLVVKANSDLLYPGNIVVKTCDIAGYVCSGYLNGRGCSQSWAMTRTGVVRCPECNYSISLHIATGRFDRSLGDVLAVECRNCGEVKILT